MGFPDNRIPEDQLPKCWTDDIRMNALFAPFRLKSSNPESWEMKMKFWSDLLKIWCRCKEDPIVSAADAKVAFQRKGRTPACIDIVIEELFRNGDLSPITKYQQILHNGTEGWVRWGARLAFKPATIALTAVSYMLPKKQLVDTDGLPKASIDSTQRFVVESVVQDQATQLLQNFPAGAERLGTVDDLMSSCNRTPADREAFEILLGYLVSQGLAVKKGDVVKLAPSTAQKAEPITESDEALYKLICAERNLARDSARFARDAATAAADAKSTLQLGNRLAAKSHLRRKHVLQERANKCDAALDNVRQLLHNMREMEVNKAVLDTYRTSSAAMKRNMTEGGLSEDSVHDTMDDLKDVLTTYSEVERALSTSQCEDLDAAELEEELMELLAGKPDGGSGGTPQKSEKTNEPLKLPSPPKSLTPPARRVNSERDFIFDGEEQMLAELERLDIEDSKLNEKERAKSTKVKLAVGDWSERKKDRPTDRPSQSWYPKDSEFASKDAINKSLDELCNSFAEIRTDQRLHPAVPYRFPLATTLTQLFRFIHFRFILHFGFWCFGCSFSQAPLTRGFRILNAISDRADIFVCSLNDFARSVECWLCYGNMPTHKNGQKLSIDYRSPPALYRSEFQVQDQIRVDDGVWLYNCREGTDDLHASTEFESSESPRQRIGLNFIHAPGAERPHKADPWRPDPRESDPDPTSDPTRSNESDPTKVLFDTESSLGPGYIGNSNKRHNSLEDLQRRLDSLRGFKL